MSPAGPRSSVNLLLLRSLASRKATGSYLATRLWEKMTLADDGPRAASGAWAAPILLNGEARVARAGGGCGCKEAGEPNAAGTEAGRGGGGGARDLNRPPVGAVVWPALLKRKKPGPLVGGCANGLALIALSTPKSTEQGFCCAHVCCWFCHSIFRRRSSTLSRMSSATSPMRAPGAKFEMPRHQHGNWVVEAGENGLRGRQGNAAVGPGLRRCVSELRVKVEHPCVRCRGED